MDDDTHPSDQAFQAGHAYARNLKRRSHANLNEAEQRARGLSKAYEDDEAYMDGFWNGLPDEVR